MIIQTKIMNGLAAIVANFALGCAAPVASERVGLRTVSDSSLSEAGAISGQQVVGVTGEEGNEKNRKQIEHARFTYNAPADKPEQYAGAVQLPLPDVADAHVEVLGHGRSDGDSFRTGAGLLGSYPLGDGKFGLQFLGQTAEQKGVGSTLLDSAATYEIDNTLRLQFGSMASRTEKKDDLFDIRGSCVGQYDNFVLGVGGRTDLDMSAVRRRVVASLANLPKKSGGDGFGFRMLYHSNFAGSTRFLAAAGLFNVSTAQAVKGPLSADALNGAGPLITNPGNDLNAIPPTLFAYTGPDFAVSGTAELRLNVADDAHMQRLILDFTVYPADIARRISASTPIPVLNQFYIGAGPSILSDKKGHVSVGDYLHAGIRTGYGITILFEKDRDAIAGRFMFDALACYNALKEPPKTK